MPRESSSGQVNNWGRSPTAIPQWGSYAPGGTPSSGAFGWTWPFGVRRSSGQNLMSTVRFHSAFIISEISTLTAVRIVVEATAQAGSTIRMGIYNANSYWEAGTLLADFGTVDSSTTGNKEITGLNQVLLPGRYYAALEGSNSSSVTRSWEALLGSGTDFNTFGGLFTCPGNSGAAFPATTGTFSAVTSFAQGGSPVALFMMQLKAGT